MKIRRTRQMLLGFMGASLVLVIWVLFWMHGPGRTWALLLAIGALSVNTMRYDAYVRRARRDSVDK